MYLWAHLNLGECYFLPRHPEHSEESADRDFSSAAQNDEFFRHVLVSI